jgi:hypothetical protein
VKERPGHSWQIIIIIANVTFRPINTFEGDRIVKRNPSGIGNDTMLQGAYEHYFDRNARGRWNYSGGFGFGFRSALKILNAIKWLNFSFEILVESLFFIAF